MLCGDWKTGARRKTRRKRISRHAPKFMTTSNTLQEYPFWPAPTNLSIEQRVGEEKVKRSKGRQGVGLEKRIR